MYPNIFLKLCNLLREKTSLTDTRYISLEEMVASFLLVVGQNSRYCYTRDTFKRSKFAISENFLLVVGQNSRYRLPVPEGTHIYIYIYINIL